MPNHIIYYRKILFWKTLQNYQQRQKKCKRFWWFCCVSKNVLSPVEFWICFSLFLQNYRLHVLRYLRNFGSQIWAQLACPPPKLFLGTPVVSPSNPSAFFCRSQKSLLQFWDLGLKEIENILPQSRLSIVYYALVESQLRYGDVVWGSLSRTKLAVLRRLQTQALRIIRNAKIKDTWSCPRMIVENIICFDRKLWPIKSYSNFAQIAF